MTTQRNIILNGDCLVAVQHLLQGYRGKLKLIYIDPPYFSGTDYSIKRKGSPNRNHAPQLNEKHTYSDKWDGGLSEYLDFMRERLQGMKELLSEEGSIWVHLDYHVSHYIKTIMDEVFGYQNFANEIIWKRTNSPKAQSRGFGSQHDVILLYAADSTRFRTNPVYRVHDDSSLRPYSYKDERGRFRLIEIEAQGIQRTKSRKQFEWRGRIAPYLYRKETLDDWWASNLIYTSRNGRYSKKQYLDDSPGVLVSDLWLDIPPIQGSSSEYSGFLTQKPLALLYRVIESATDKGDIVCDFFAGSGTTAIAAHQLDRRWIICDSTSVAIELSEKRLKEIHAEGSYEMIQLES